MFFIVPTSLIHEAAAPPENYQSKCGNRNEQGVDVTVDGKEDRKQLTQFGEWPNMCAISTLVSRNSNKIYIYIYIYIYVPVILVHMC